MIELFIATILSTIAAPKDEAGTGRVLIMDGSCTRCLV